MGCIEPLRTLKKALDGEIFIQLLTAGRAVLKMADEFCFLFKFQRIIHKCRELVMDFYALHFSLLYIKRRNEDICSPIFYPTDHFSRSNLCSASRARAIRDLTVPIEI